jgi:hypothetical protein
MIKEAFIAQYVHGFFGRLIDRGMLDKDLMEKSAQKMGEPLFKAVRKNLGSIFGGDVPDEVLAGLKKMDANDPIAQIGRNDLLMRAPGNLVKGNLEMLPHVGKLLQNPQERKHIEQIISSMKVDNPNLSVRDLLEDATVKRMLDPAIAAGKPLDQVMDFENVLYKHPRTGGLPGLSDAGALIKFFKPDPSGMSGYAPDALNLYGNKSIYRSGHPLWAGMPEAYVTTNPLVAAHHADVAGLNAAQRAAKQRRALSSHGIGWSEVDMQPALQRVRQLLGDTGHLGQWYT